MGEELDKDNRIKFFVEYDKCIQENFDKKFEQEAQKNSEILKNLNAQSDDLWEELTTASNISRETTNKIKNFDKTSDTTMRAIDKFISQCEKKEESVASKIKNIMSKVKDGSLNFLAKVLVVKDEIKETISNIGTGVSNAISNIGTKIKLADAKLDNTLLKADNAVFKARNIVLDVPEKIAEKFDLLKKDIATRKHEIEVNLAKTEGFVKVVHSARAQSDIFRNKVLTNNFSTTTSFNAYNHDNHILENERFDLSMQGRKFSPYVEQGHQIPPRPQRTQEQITRTATADMEKPNTMGRNFDNYERIPDEKLFEPKKQLEDEIFEPIPEEDVFEPIPEDENVFEPLPPEVKQDFSKLTNEELKQIVQFNFNQEASFAQNQIVGTWSATPGQTLDNALVALKEILNRYPNLETGTLVFNGVQLGVDAMANLEDLKEGYFEILKYKKLENEKANSTPMFNGNISTEKTEAEKCLDQGMEK